MLLRRGEGTRAKIWSGCWLWCSSLVVVVVVGWCGKLLLAHDVWPINAFKSKSCRCNWFFSCSWCGILGVIFYWHYK